MLFRSKTDLGRLGLTTLNLLAVVALSLVLTGLYGQDSTVYRGTGMLMDGDAGRKELTIRHQVNAGQFLGVKDDRRCVSETLIGWKCGQPVWYWITADNSGEEFGHVGSGCWFLDKLYLYLFGIGFQMDRSRSSLDP